MSEYCNGKIKKVLKLTQEMMVLADQGDARRDDIGCGVLFGTLRDSAYKLRALAESEMAEHQRRGKWHEPAAV